MRLRELRKLVEQIIASDTGGGFLPDYSNAEWPTVPVTLGIGHVDDVATRRERFASEIGWRRVYVQIVNSSSSDSVSGNFLILDWDGISFDAMSFATLSPNSGCTLSADIPPGMTYDVVVSQHSYVAWVVEVPSL